MQGEKYLSLLQARPGKNTIPTYIAETFEFAYTFQRRRMYEDFPTPIFHEMVGFFLSLTIKLIFWGSLLLWWEKVHGRGGRGEIGYKGHVFACTQST